MEKQRASWARQKGSYILDIGLGRHPPGMVLINVPLPTGVTASLKICVINPSDRNPPPCGKDQT